MQKSVTACLKSVTDEGQILFKKLSFLLKSVTACLKSVTDEGQILSLKTIALQNSEKDNPDFFQRTFLSSELSLMSLIGNCMVTKSTGCHPGSFLFQIFYFPIVPCSDLINALMKPVSRSLTNDYFSPDFALSFSPNSFI